MLRVCLLRLRRAGMEQRHVGCWPWRLWWRAWIVRRRLGRAGWTCGMDRQTLRDWVHRYNEGSLAALSNRHAGGPAKLLTAAQKQEFKQIVLTGPDLAKDGVVRWRCADMQRVIKERFEVTMAERTVAKLLHALGLSRLTPRPRHPKQALQAQENFKKLHGRPERAATSPRQRQANRSTVSGRSTGRAKRIAHLYLGPARLKAAKVARPAPRFGLAVRCRLRRTRGRCWPGDGVHECRSNGPAPRRDQFPCRAWRACRGRTRRRGLAPNQRTTAGARQHHPDAAPAQLSRIEPGRKRLAISPPERTQLHRLGQRRRHRRRCLLRRSVQTH